MRNLKFTIKYFIKKFWEPIEHKWITAEFKLSDFPSLEVVQKFKAPYTYEYAVLPESKKDKFFQELYNNIISIHKYVYWIQLDFFNIYNSTLTKSVHPQFLIIPDIYDCTPSNTRNKEMYKKLNEIYQENGYFKLFRKNLFSDIVKEPTHIGRTYSGYTNKSSDEIKNGIEIELEITKIGGKVCSKHLFFPNCKKITLHSEELEGTCEYYILTDGTKNSVQSELLQLLQSNSDIEKVAVKNTFIGIDADMSNFHYFQADRFEKTLKTHYKIHHSRALGLKIDEKPCSKYSHYYSNIYDVKPLSTKDIIDYYSMTQPDDNLDRFDYDDERW